MIVGYIFILLSIRATVEELNDLLRNVEEQLEEFVSAEPNFTLNTSYFRNKKISRDNKHTINNSECICETSQNPNSQVVFTTNNVISYKSTDDFTYNQPKFRYTKKLLEIARLNSGKYKLHDGVIGHLKLCMEELEQQSLVMEIRIIILDDICRKACIGFSKSSGREWKTCLTCFNGMLNLKNERNMYSNFIRDVTAIKKVYNEIKPIESCTPKQIKKLAYLNSMLQNNFVRNEEDVSSSKMHRYFSLKRIKKVKIL